VLTSCCTRPPVYSILALGSPFHVNVIDPSKATARGDGLDMIQCNQTTAFYVTAPAAQLKDFDIKIIGNYDNIIFNNNNNNNMT